VRWLMDIGLFEAVGGSNIFADIIRCRQLILCRPVCQKIQPGSGRRCSKEKIRIRIWLQAYRRSRQSMGFKAPEVSRKSQRLKTEHFTVPMWQA
jgi:hypothetical protein